MTKCEAYPDDYELAFLECSRPSGHPGQHLAVYRWEPETPGPVLGVDVPWASWVDETVLAELDPNSVMHSFAAFSKVLDKANDEKYEFRFEDI